jgi:hypothetical protein
MTIIKDLGMAQSMNRRAEGIQYVWLYRDEEKRGVREKQITYCMGNPNQVFGTLPNQNVSTNAPIESLFAI